MSTKKAYGQYIISLLLFGSNGIVASRIALNSYEIVFTRTLIGSLFLAVIFMFSRKNRASRQNGIASEHKIQLFKNKKHLGYLIISGAALGAGWMFLYEAYQQIGVSIATLAYYCGPVIILVLSPLIFRERIPLAKLPGILAVLLGMFFLNLNALSEGQTLWGLFCGIMSAVMYAIMVIFNKKAESFTGLFNSLGQLCISFLTVAIFIGIKEGYSLSIEPGSIMPILILGIVNTGIGCYLYFSSIGNLPVQTVAIFGYLEPLAALVFSTIFLGESLNVVQVIGAGLILGGAAFGEFFRPKDSFQKVGQSL